MASITITTNNGQTTRLLSAFRAMTGNPEAGESEIKQWLIAHLRKIVHEHERQEQINAITPSATFDPS